MPMAGTPELLLGWYDDWVVIERERLTQLHLTALESLSDRLLSDGEHAKALQVALAAVQVDPLRESGHSPGPEVGAIGVDVRLETIELHSGNTQDNPGCGAGSLPVPP